MLEIGILVFILLAIGYWATLWIMGRRDDVLHGQFVEFEDAGEPVAAMAAPHPQPPPVHVRLKPAPARSKPPASKPLVAAPAANAETLQSLLASIKQELNDASKI